MVFFAVVLHEATTISLVVGRDAFLVVLAMLMAFCSLRSLKRRCHSSRSFLLTTPFLSYLLFLVQEFTAQMIEIYLKVALHSNSSRRRHKTLCCSRTLVAYCCCNFARSLHVSQSDDYGSLTRITRSIFVYL